jgi:Uma2 family endonuclease
MPSPVRDRHGIISGLAITWLNFYRFRTLGIVAGQDISTILDDENEVQPDALLRRLPDYGGRSRVIQGTLHGAPELVIEVTWSSRSIDLGTKLREYERTGVIEYLVFAMEPDEILWHVREGDRLVRLPAGPDGIFRSSTFPGLWLDPAALYNDDGLALMATLERGLESDEHAAFLAELSDRRIL